MDEVPFWRGPSHETFCRNALASVVKTRAASGVNGGRSVIFGTTIAAYSPAS